MDEDLRGSSLSSRNLRYRRAWEGPLKEKPRILKPKFLDQEEKLEKTTWGSGVPFRSGLAVKIIGLTSILAKSSWPPQEEENNEAERTKGCLDLPP